MNCLECEAEFEPKQRFCSIKCKNRYSYISGKADKSTQSLNSATTLKGTKPQLKDENTPQVSKNGKKKGKMVFNLKRGVCENV